MLLLAALILSATIGTSCNKNSDRDGNQEGIVAKWTLEKVDYHDYEAGASDRYTEVAMAGDYFDFLSINTNNLVLFIKETDGADYYEATAYFKK
jgi:hypothetical protein